LKVKTAVDKALAKIKPELREKAIAGGEELVNVSVTALKGTDVSQYMTQSFTRPFVALGEQTTFGLVKAGSLLKLASLPGVTSIRPVVFGPSARPIPPPDPDVRPPAFSVERLRARMAELKAIDKPWSGEIEYRRAKQPTGWFDVGPGHKSSMAWAKGYTGEGVRVAVLDDSVDFGHPDLMGTQAVVEDETSPYYGWPMAFSPYSMLLYAYDQYLGYTFVADGASWYVDTSETPPVVRSFEDYQNGTARLRYTPLAGSFGERSFEHEYIFYDTSKSGVYHIGSHPDDLLLEVFGERVAVLVVDENEEGVYDTVYVDLDNDYDFRDEKPVTKDSPISYRDMDGDGYADISGGMVYFIADGVNPIPIADWYWGLGMAGNDVQDFGEPDNGALVAFHGAFDFEGGFPWDHGTLCASNVVGQGIINGGAPTFRDLPGDGTPPGMVWGGAPDAEMVGISNIYFNFDDSRIDAYIFSVFGYDGIPGSGDEVQITSNSYGESDVDNDGWEYYGRYVDRLVRRYSPTTSFLFSTGNGAPGYGTVAPPSPSTGMGIGASTQMGSTGWDSITETVQITYGDVINWSNRGPGATGSTGVSVVADGAFASGALPVNEFFDGWIAWTTWGGTSRSSPVAMGNLALVYQAFKEANGRWPTYEEARAIFMSGATNLHYDVFVQGAGSVNADRATDVAGGLYGVYVMPESWRAGDYRGTEYPGFANIVKPGDTVTQTFTIHNPSSRDITVSLSDDILTKIGEKDITFTSVDVAEESKYNFNRPNYILDDLKDDIPEGTDLMVVRVIFPFDQFDPDGDYEYDNRWRVLVYDWTDIDGDGVYWNDLDEDGVVDDDEMEEGEYIRFTYGYNSGTYLEARVQRPLERMNDPENGGILLGLQHSTASDLVPTTDLTIKIEFYQHSDWDLLTLSDTSLTVPAGSSATFEATINVPPDMAVGVYEGAILVDDPGFLYQVYLPLILKGAEAIGVAAASARSVALKPANAHQTVVPVVVNVAAEFTDIVELGGPAADDPDALYNNGVVRGGFDWLWRAESGDWRFFFLDVPTAPAPGTKLIVRDVWIDDAPPTDLDTIIMGPTVDPFTDPAHRYYDPTYYGPYTLDTVGKSTNTYLGRGKWRFDTATGGAEEWVTAPLQEGLHLIAQHNVLFSGKKFAVPFGKTVSTVSVEPPAIEIYTPSDSGSVPIVFTSGMELPGLAAEGYGLSVTQVFTDQLAYQDDPADPTTASYTRLFTVTHASRLAVSTGDAPGQDLDLYVYYDANGDGVFEHPGELIGSSTTPYDTEFVSVRLPPDGSYMAAVHGWSVSPSPTTFTLTLDIIQGYDLTITGVPDGVIPANTPITLTMSYSKTMVPGETWKGEVLLGPTAAPAALSIPVTIHRTSLAILHTNDFHGNLESDYKGRGGSAYMAGVINDIRAALGEDNVFLMDAGDVFLGAPPISQLLLGESTIDIYNMLEYDVAAFGNHEFDKGQDVLQDRVEQSDFPWVSANIVLEGTDWEHPTWVEPYVILSKDEVDLGVIGLTTDETPLVTLKGTTEGLEFKDLTEAVLHYYDEVEAQSDAVIVLAHMGTQDSGEFKGLQTVAQELIDAGKPVDLIIGGHQHEYLDEPVWVDDTPIIVAYKYGRVLGRADITIDSDTQSFTLVNYEYITINNTLTPDPEVEARVQYWAEQVAPYIERVVGYTNVSLVRNYNGESNMGNLVTDGMRWKADQYDDGEVNGSVDIAFTNPGGLRADIEIPVGATLPYTITWGDTFNVMPFGNTLYLMDLTGAQIQELLDQAASLYKGILQTSGATWKWYNDCQCDTPTTWGALDVMVNGEPLDPEATYRVVTNNFLAGGKDGWVTFAEGTNRWDTYYDMQEAVNEYIQWYNTTVGPIDYEVEGRIVYVSVP